MIIALIKDIYESCHSLSNLILHEKDYDYNDKNVIKIKYFNDKPIKPLSSHHNLSELICTELCSDNRIYFGHNLDLLEIYRNKHINIVEKELKTKYDTINFVFCHKTKKNLPCSIEIIYVIYDDFNIVIRFIGVNHKNNNNIILSKQKN